MIFWLNEGVFERFFSLIYSCLIKFIEIYTNQNTKLILTNQTKSRHYINFWFLEGRNLNLNFVMR